MEKKLVPTDEKKKIQNQWRKRRMLGNWYKNCDKLQRKFRIQRQEIARKIQKSVQVSRKKNYCRNIGRKNLNFENSKLRKNSKILKRKLN